MALEPCCDKDTDGDGNCPWHPPGRTAKPTMDGLTEPAPVICLCTHDLSQHTQGFFAPCNAEGCECDDFTIDEEMERKEI